FAQGSIPDGLTAGRSPAFFTTTDDRGTGIRVVSASPVFGRLSVACRCGSYQRNEAGAENDARPVMRALLHHDDGSIDFGGLDIRDRHAPGRFRAGPIAKLDPAPHHVVIGDRAPAIFAAADLHRNGSRQRTEPDFAAEAILT